MASIRKKPGLSQFWFACYYREDGSRTQTSTKTTDRKEAQRIADELEQAHTRRMTEGQMRRVLSDLHERIAGAPIAVATLREYAKQWLELKEKEVSRLSFLAYKSAVNGFVDGCAAKADQGIQYVSVADVTAYRDKCAARTTAKTANNRLKIVRTFLQAAWVAGLIQENPAAKVKVLPTEDSVRRPFSIPELRSLLAVANDEWRGMILAGLYTGQRLKDIATLSWANLDLAGKTMKLRTSKTDRFMELPIAKPLMKHLMTLEAGDDPKAPLFPAAAKLVAKDGDVGRVSQDFYDLLVTANLAKERLGKDESKGIGRGGRRDRNELTFHCLRHTATSLLKNAGVSEAVAMDIIGHDSKAVSGLYTHIEHNAKRDALNKLPDVTAKKTEYAGAKRRVAK